MREIFVRIEYEPGKIKKLMDMDMKSLAMNVRRDFSLLKLDHPPEGSIREPTVHGVVVSWETHKHSVRGRLYSCTSHLDARRLDSV